MLPTPMPKEIHVWTMQMAQWRLAREMDVHVLDITVMSGIKAFAPEWWALRGYQRKEISEEEYTRLYHARMHDSKIKAPRSWESLFKRPRVALACYCKAGVFCHRLLFKDLMQEHLKQHHVKMIDEGELTRKPS